MTPHHRDEGIKRHANPSGGKTACKTLSILRDRLRRAFFPAQPRDISNGDTAFSKLLHNKGVLGAMQKPDNDPSYGILS